MKIGWAFFLLNDLSQCHACCLKSSKFFSFPADKVFKLRGITGCCFTSWGSPSSRKKGAPPCLFSPASCGIVSIDLWFPRHYQITAFEPKGLWVVFCTVRCLCPAKCVMHYWCVWKRTAKMAKKNELRGLWTLWYGSVMVLGLFRQISIAVKKMSRDMSFLSKPEKLLRWIFLIFRYEICFT